MKIIPAPNHVYIKIEIPKAGVLNVSSKPSAIEYAEVLEVGKDVMSVKKGDMILFKSWAVDIISKEDETYHFIDITSGGIKAVVK